MEFFRQGFWQELWGDLIAPCKGVYKKAGEGLSSRACDDWKRGDGFKLKDSLFRLATRKKIL